MNQPIKLAVLLSGGGRTLQNIQEKINQGQLNAQVVLVVSSKAEAYGVTRAKDLGLNTHVVARKTYDNLDAYSDEIWRLIREANAELVCCAGFLSLLNIADDYANRVINVHPSLLPSFGGKGMYGNRVHQAVIDHGCKVSGCTVHYCDQTYDTGPIIAQAACEVLDNDNADKLAARVFEKECELYPKAIELVVEQLSV